MSMKSLKTVVVDVIDLNKKERGLDILVQHVAKCCRIDW